MAAFTSGHEAAIRWMATEEFRAIVAGFRAVAGGRDAVYFRPTHAGVVMLALHENAPSALGVRRHATDAPVLRIGEPVSMRDIEERWAAFEAWLPSVKRRSEEERGVARWVRSALGNQLRMPELGEDWVFLAGEWRFLDVEGIGKKSDVLAVHVPTRRLGIVELKESAPKVDGARAQVEAYGRYWDRDGAQLAPLFTSLLRAQGAAAASPGSVELTRRARSETLPFASTLAGRRGCTPAGPPTVLATWQASTAEDRDVRRAMRAPNFGDSCCARLFGSASAAAHTARPSPMRPARTYRKPSLLQPPSMMYAAAQRSPGRAATLGQAAATTDAANAWRSHAARAWLEAYACGR